jgi:hypothetical protein
MHIQHNESTSGQTWNISIAPPSPSAHTITWNISIAPPSPLHPHNTKLTFDTRLWTWCAESHTGVQVSERPGRYILRFISHVLLNIKYFFSLLDENHDHLWLRTENHSISYVFFQDNGDARNLTSFKTRMIHVLTCLSWWWNFMIGNHRNGTSEA